MHWLRRAANPLHHVTVTNRASGDLEGCWKQPAPRKKKKNYVSRGNSPYINQGKGDALAQKSLDPAPRTQL
eukprot:501139-Pelagomonas_calceolata.AAC.8